MGLDREGNRTDKYAGWDWDPNSEFNQKMQRTYKDTFKGRSCRCIACRTLINWQRYPVMIFAEKELSVLWFCNETCMVFERLRARD